MAVPFYMAGMEICMNKKKKKFVSYAKWGYIFLIPFFAVYIVFSLIPLISTFYNSFFENYMVGLMQVGPKFVGFDNYKAILFNGDTLLYLKNTMIMWLMGFIPQILISLLLASWFTDLRLRLKCTGFFKTIIYMPNLIMASAFAMLFYAIFADQGPINNMLNSMGYDDSYRVFSNNVSAPWVDSNNKIVIDDNIMKWVDQTKKYTDKGYNNKSSLWDSTWAADQGPSGKVFGFFYSTWGINFTLLGNSLATPVKEGGKEEVGNGIYGDYAVCEGPQSYYWGGTWICAAAGTDNANLVKDVMKTLCCDKATMKKITEDTQDYTNTTSGMNEIASSNFKSDFLGGQNHIKLFAKSAPKISMKNISSYDQGLNEEFQKAMKDYFDGNVTKDKALDNFYKAAIEKYPNLSK